MKNSNKNSGPERISRYANLISDAGFKAVLADPANKKLLIKFLNMFLVEEMRISDITEYMDREDNGCGENCRDFRCDLKCVTENGRIFIIEMQKKVHDCFFQRCIYYGSRAYGRELKRGDFFTDLTPVVVFALLGEKYSHTVPELWPDNEDLVARYEFIETRTREFAPSSISTIFVELARFTKEKCELDGEFDTLFYLLKHIHELDEVPEEMLIGINRELVEASEIAAFDDDKRNQYETDIMTELDYKYVLEYTARTSREEGKAEGIAEGKAAIANAMLSDGADVRLIAKYTGLTIEQIEKLK